MMIDRLRIPGRPAWVVFPLVLFSQFGCVVGGRDELLGFPGVQSATPSETADRAMEIVRTTERRILAAIAEGEEKDVAWKRAAWLRLMDAYVALSNDEIGASTGMNPQGTTTRRPPLYLYPRVTSPLIAEPSGAPGGPPAWILPVILNRRAFERPRRVDAYLGTLLASLLFAAREHELDQWGSHLYGKLQRHFRFSLVARNLTQPQEIVLDAVPERFLPTRSTEQSTQDPDLVRLREDAIEILFRLPASELDARWKRLCESRGGAEVEEELFDLRMFPHLPLDASRSRGPWRGVAEALAHGGWLEARDLLRGLIRSGGPPPSAGEAEALAKAADTFTTVFHHFARPLEGLSDAARSLAAPAPAPTALTSLLQVIDRVIQEDDCPAPVLLDRPRPGNRSFSFIACGDVQYHANGSKLFSLLAMIDPERAPREAPAPIPSPAIPRELIEELQAAKFILIAGDFGDGQGFSSSGIAPALDGLGLLAPQSPYRDLQDPAVGEFPELREQIRRSSKAIFAVPGNHDGFASYGGVLNQTAAGAGYLLQLLPLTSVIGTWLTDKVSYQLPILVRVARITPPFYDGLVDWSYELGPRNVAFNFRGCAFVAPNSFDLYQVDRDQVGAIANNFGGMLQDVSLAWTDLALRHFSNLDRAARRLPSSAGPRQSFLFMHHAPTGAIASKTGFVERYFGTYHTIVAPLNELTLGYFGTHSNRYSGAFIPIVTPLAAQVIGVSGEGENFHERWMRHTVWDDTCGNARGLIQLINRNLSGAPPITPGNGGAPYPSAEISHLFFAHDDVPIVSDWLHPPGDSVFPDPAETDSSGLGESLKGIASRPRHSGTPSWGAEMTFHDGRRATVIRMDDVGDAHDRNNTNGFHLVTVTFPPAGSPVSDRPQVRVRWIQIPR
jgi:hypothetical protein